MNGRVSDLCIVARRKQLIDKKLIKKVAGKCRICGESAYELLDVHRLVAGEDGGRYIRANTTVICVSCHRKVHAGKITIDGWYSSTAGYLLRWIDEEGVEHFS